VGLTVGAVKALIKTYQERYNRTIYFVDRQGVVKLAGFGFDPTAPNISQLPFFTQLKEEGNGSPHRSLRYEKDGHVTHAYIRTIDEFDWYLVVEQPETETIRQIHTTLLANLGVCIAVTLVVLALINAAVSAYQKRIETLRGIVPICSYCKQIRDDKGYWNKVEEYVSQHTDAKFSHSICPACLQEHFPREYEAIQEKNDRP
jgi:molybdopterin synthase catalytic subunit